MTQLDDPDFAWPGDLLYLFVLSGWTTPFWRDNFRFLFAWSTSAGSCTHSQMINVYRKRETQYKRKGDRGWQIMRKDYQNLLRINAKDEERTHLLLYYVSDIYYPSFNKFCGCTSIMRCTTPDVWYCVWSSSKQCNNLLCSVAYRTFFPPTWAHSKVAVIS